MICGNYPPRAKRTLKFENSPESDPSTLVFTYRAFFTAISKYKITPKIKQHSEVEKPRKILRETGTRTVPRSERNRQNREREPLELFHAQTETESNPGRPAMATHCNMFRRVTIRGAQPSAPQGSPRSFCLSEGFLEASARVS